MHHSTDDHTIPPVSPDLIETELNEALLALLRPAAAFILGLHAFLILIYPLQDPWPLWGYRAMVTGGSGAIVLTGFFLLRRGQVDAARVYPFAAFFLALPIVADTAGNYYLTRDPLLLSYFLLTAVLFGYFTLNRRWFFLVEGFNIAAGILTRLATGERFAESAPYAGILFASLLAAYFLNLAHRRSLMRMITLRHGERLAREVAENLQHAGAALTSRLSTPAVLEAVLNNLANVLDCDRAAVLLKEGDSLVITASKGFPPPGGGASYPKLFIGDASDHGIFPQIVRTRMALHLTDVRQREDWIYLPGIEPAAVWLGTPLIRGDEVIGILSLVRTSQRPYTREEMDRAAIFAGQVAIALQNASLYEQIAAFSQKLEKEVEARTEDLQRAFTHLEKLDRAKTDFINIMSHEIRTPLTVVRGYVQMLARDPSLAADPQIASYINGINMGSFRLQELVDSLLVMVKIDNQTLEIAWTEFAIIDLLKLVIGELEEILKSRRQTCEIEPAVADLPPIIGDFDLLQKVFTNLLLNGIKYTPDEGCLTIGGRVSSRPGNDPTAKGVEIVVSDTGIGIPPEMQELIFTKFFQTGQVDLHSSSKIKFKGGGAGLGLSIARGIIDHHRGHIWVESPGQDENTLPGSHFHVWLPFTQ